MRALAAHAHVSERTLARRWAAETGLPVLQWLLAQRVDAARAALETTGADIEEVARRTGFGSAANLRKHFRRHVATTPTAYRRSFGPPRSSGRTNHSTTSSSATSRRQDDHAGAAEEQVRDQQERRRSRPPGTPARRSCTCCAVSMMYARSCWWKRSRCVALGAMRQAAETAVAQQRDEEHVLLQAVARWKPWANGTVSRNPNRICTPGSATRSSLSSSIICRSLLRSSSFMSSRARRSSDATSANKAASRRSSTPPWAPKNVPGVLAAHVALDQRLEQVAERRRDRHRDAEQQAVGARDPVARVGLAGVPDGQPSRPRTRIASPSMVLFGEIRGASLPRAEASARPGRRRCRRGTCPAGPVNTSAPPCTEPAQQRRVRPRRGRPRRREHRGRHAAVIALAPRHADGEQERHRHARHECEQHLALASRRSRGREPGTAIIAASRTGRARSSITVSSCTAITAERADARGEDPAALVDDERGERDRRDRRRGRGRAEVGRPSAPAEPPPARARRPSSAASRSAREKSGHSTSVKCSSL